MRESVRDLAIAGAPPAFQSPLHVGRPNIGDRDRLMERISDMLDRRWFSNAGVYVSEFERRLADMLDVEHCIVMCNGTVALEIAIRALGLEGRGYHSLPDFYRDAPCTAMATNQASIL